MYFIETTKNAKGSLTGLKYYLCTNKVITKGRLPENYMPQHDVQCVFEK